MSQQTDTLSRALSAVLSVHQQFPLSGSNWSSRAVAFEVRLHA